MSKTFGCKVSSVVSASRSLRDLSLGNVLLGVFPVAVMDLCPVTHAYISLVTLGMSSEAAD